MTSVNVYIKPRALKDVCIHCEAEKYAYTQVLLQVQYLSRGDGSVSYGVSEDN